MPSTLTQVAILIAFASLVGWAAISDFSRFIIPNRICLAIVALYPAHVLAGGAIDWQGAALLAAATFAAGSVLFALRIVGGGDVKFLAAVTLWVGPAQFWPFMIVMALAGGVLALAYIVATRAWRPLAVRAIGMASGIEQHVLPETLRVPYGIAIAVGGLCAVAQLAMP